MQMREEMDRLFNQFVRRGDGEEGAWIRGMWAPSVDIYENEDAFVLKAELPGFTKDDVQIELHNNRPTLRGERKQESEAKEDQYHRRERAYGCFERSFMLPTMIDADKVTASFALRMASSSCGYPRANWPSRSGLPFTRGREPVQDGTRPAPQRNQTSSPVREEVWDSALAP